jgi:cytidylate kinase
MKIKKKLTIAIDGPAASGKSTTAKILAKTLGYVYFDTGAMYRAVTLAALNNKIDPDDIQQVAEVAEKSIIRLKIINGEQHTFLNGKNVSDEIRTPQIDLYVSKIANNSAVRKILVQHQRNAAKEGGIVMDGRDIGTVVLPDADLKVYLQASIDARARRRFKDQAGHNISLEDIKNDIARRDHNDMSRSDSPLRKAHDAKALDNSGMTIEQQVKQIMQWIVLLDNQGSVIN